jgi:hypothetical protein
LIPKVRKWISIRLIFITIVLSKSEKWTIERRSINKIAIHNKFSLKKWKKGKWEDEKMIINKIEIHTKYSFKKWKSIILNSTKQAGYSQQLFFQKMKIMNNWKNEHKYDCYSQQIFF